jgi:hypothetical protein
VPNFVPSPLRSIPLLLALAFSAMGCRVEIEDDDGYDYGWAEDDWGTLTVEWSVDDSFDRDACADFGADYMELIVYDRRGRTETEVEASCDDFDVTIDLPSGSYSLDATLIDRRDRAVTTTLALDDVRVYEDDETLLPLDFPADSLL